MQIEPKREKNQRAYKVLSLDGGGVRGIFPVQLLLSVEKKLEIRIYDTFDLIVGTSTGSITAAAISIKYPLAQLVERYATWAEKIFKRKKRIPYCYSKYDSRPLEDFLHEVLGNIKLGEIEKPLVINATDVSNGDVYVFKSSYQGKQRGRENYFRDNDTPLFKAVLASCAAPTYFDPVDINGTLVCDGGIWANNPALVGYVDVKVNFQAKSIKVFSLGTGKTKQCYKSPKLCGWGLFTGWKREKFVDFVMTCQTIFPQNSLKLIDNESIYRINPLIEDCDLDNFKAIPILRETAESAFEKEQTKIKEFLT